MPITKQQNVSLKPITTFGVDVKAKELIEKFNVKSIEELKILSNKDSSLLNQSQVVWLNWAKNLLTAIEALQNPIKKEEEKEEELHNK